MKMTQAHYKQLSGAIKQTIADHPGALQECKDKGFSMMRYRWTLFNMTCDRDRYTLANEIYQYCNDDQIDTALRKITGTK